MNPDEVRPTGSPAAPGRGSSMEEPEAEAEGKVFQAGAEEAAGSGSRAGAEHPTGGDVAADLDRLLEERDEYLELAKRARADFENYRKRAAREAEDAERRGRSTLARSLIPTLDNLERALRSAGIDPDAGEEPAPDHPSEEVSAQQALARGVALVHRELRDALTRAGVESYDPAGESFDPAWHEAVATRPANGAKPGTVLETVEKGYRLDGQVLRAAKVIVGE